MSQPGGRAFLCPLVHCLVVNFVFLIISSSCFLREWLKPRQGLSRLRVPLDSERYQVRITDDLRTGNLGTAATGIDRKPTEFGNIN